ncbi:monosaccharide ABC transporter membrane protein, CUT2 family [Pedococcus cremeus]|uniref:Monosaccharide ABC transporter membrane protein, CUT2 family n=1 Tax=Pedococcus cremeus TaxID=587636 RepID=A0A1H9TE25_9MICO|nr:monosaccharide ABC transporter membrane protein, CUT2 family [Pedococcus cremeus]
MSNTQETTPTAQKAPGADVTSKRAKIADFVSANGALVGLLVLCVAMFIATPDFLTPNNLLNVGIQASVVAILAFGQTFVIVTAGIDLSVGSVAALSAMVAAFTGQSWGMPPLVALLFGLLTGLAAGMLSGAATAYAKLPPFIATLAMLSVARGLTLVVSNGIPVPTSSVVTWLGGSIGPIPMPVVVLLVMGAIGWFILNRLSVGRAMYAVGGNLEAARLSGIPVKRVLVTVYALSGIFAAVAGLVLSGRLASAQPQAATGYELDAIAAVVIGGASLAGGVGRISGTLIGALVLAVIRNGLNLLNVSAFWQQVIIGLVIAVAVGIDVLRRKRA